MSTKYCFKILSRDNIVSDDELINHISDIYTSHFEMGAKLPFVVIKSQNLQKEDEICIVLTSTSKKAREKIEEINNSLSQSDLKYKNTNFALPYLFEISKVDAKNIDISKKGIETVKWTNLSHRGPYFTHLNEPYVPLGAYLISKKKLYPLNPLEEKIAGFYVKRIISEEAGNVIDFLTKDEVFNTNFWNDFKQYLSKENKKVFTKLEDIDWSDLKNKILSKKEDEKNMTNDAKLARKKAIEERKQEYSYGYIDGNRELLGNYIIEPASIFMGRGKNPNRGKIKRDIEPEEVTINVGKNDNIPEPPLGHKWGKVIHDNNVEWIASWKDPISGDSKYIRFSRAGKFGVENDMMKYEKARKLNKHIKNVRNGYMSDAKSDDEVNKQLGTVLYLIDNFGIRVGNEKDESETDTVGASTLKVGNIFLKPNNIVVFDFLGKDSVRFYKELKVDELIWNNIHSFMQGKQDNNQLFDKIDATDINNYLKKFDKSFSAKVFRTRLASTIMFNELDKLDIPSDSTNTKIKYIFNTANVKVADVLNHSRTVTKKNMEAINKLEDKLSELKNKLKEIKKEPKKGDKKYDALMKKIDEMQDKINSKKDTTNIAITTSLQNYIDPRVVISWTKKNDIDSGIIYSKTLQKKFDWAIEMTPSNWNYEKTPLIGVSELVPEEFVRNEYIKRNKEKTVAPRSKEVQMKDTNESSDEILQYGDVYIRKYSEYSYIIYGDTKSHIEKLKEMGCKYNPNLKINGKTVPGWIISKNQIKNVREYFEKINEEKSNDIDKPKRLKDILRERLVELEKNEKKDSTEYKGIDINIEYYGNGNDLMTLVKYENGFIIYGPGTKKFSEKFKQMKGKYLYNVKVLDKNVSGWYIPNTMIENVRIFLKHITPVTDYELLYEMCKGNLSSNYFQYLSQDVKKWMHDIKNKYEITNPHRFYNQI